MIVKRKRKKDTFIFSHVSLQKDYVTPIIMSPGLQRVGEKVPVRGKHHDDCMYKGFYIFHYNVFIIYVCIHNGRSYSANEHRVYSKSCNKMQL